VSASAWAGNWNNQNYKQGVNKGYRFKDTDWSHTFYASAGFPSNSEDRWNARWLEEGKTKFLRFRLFKGQIGTTKVDNKNRSGASFWERAEVTSGSGANNRFYFNKSKTYEITFRVRFVKGFVGDRETFFQIHQSNKNCRVGPIIMMKFSMESFQLAYHGGNIDYENTPNINQHYGKWVKFRLIYGPSEIRKGYAATELSMNGKILAKQDLVLQSPCGQPYVKFGIYRAGYDNWPNKTSIIDYDYINIKEIIE
jgi:hypothetical protein